MRPPSTGIDLQQYLLTKALPRGPGNNIGAIKRLPIHEVVNFDAL